MISTASRPTLSLAVPSTQNTAPVLDFRCLYTYDLRRKQKRWQDGVARFHTFNKRIMVYDEPRNLIGDTHWREPEPIQDGDELQLDKGILIQIGESTGKTEQDISGLFEKKKAVSVEGNSSPARTGPTSAPVSSTTKAVQTAPSQLRPRTLNSLLGTPKGRLGRAALPVKSPFEVRHASDAGHGAGGRAAKRQRLTYPNANSTRSSPASRSQPPSERSRHADEVASTITVDDDTTEPQEEVVTRATKSLKKRSGHEPELAPRISLENETTEPQKEAVARARKSPVKVSARTKEPPLDVVNRKPPKSRVVQPRKEGSPAPAMKKAPGKAVRASSRDRDPSEVINVDSDGPSQDPISQGTRLRIAPSKPRKKLMYRDLIPKARHNGEPPSNNPQPVNHKEKRKKQTTPDIDPLSQFHHGEQDRLKARLKKHDGRRAPSLKADDELGTFESEAIFVSQDDYNDFPTGLPDDMQATISPLRISHHTGSYHWGNTHEGEEIHEIPSSLEPKPPDYPNTELARMDALLLRRSKPPIQVISPPPPPKQTTPIPPPPPLHPSPATKEPLQRSLSAVISATTGQPKRALRKTVSDTATLGSGSKTRNGSGNKRLSPVNVEAAPDPWSSEAWELFGWRKEDFVGGREGGKEGNGVVVGDL